MALLKTFEQVEVGKKAIPEPEIQRVEVDYGDAGRWKRTVMYFRTPNKFRVCEDWKITLPNGRQVMVKEDYVFTGASVPFFIRPFITAFGPLLRAALFHDHGYERWYMFDWEGNKIMKGEPRKFYDDWFREIGAVTSHLRGLACTAWTGVRAFGWIPWRKYRNNDEFVLE